MATRVQLLVGTRKGAFIYTSDERRERWELSEPMLTGRAIYHMVVDARSPTPPLLTGR